MPVDAYRLLSVLILAALLFFPVSRIIWTLGARRLSRKLDRALEPSEIQGQLRRARFLALPVVLVFSYLFHLHVLAR